MTALKLNGRFFDGRSIETSNSNSSNIEEFIYIKLKNNAKGYLLNFFH